MRDNIIKEAEEHRIYLERTPLTIEGGGENKSIEEAPNGIGFVEGFSNSLQSGLESAKDNVDTFNQIMNGEQKGGQ